MFGAFCLGKQEKSIAVQSHAVNLGLRKTQPNKRSLGLVKEDRPGILLDIQSLL